MRLGVKSFCDRLLFVNLNAMAMQRQSSHMGTFREVLKSSKNVVILTGAGMSAESGIPTFRGSGGYWRKYESSSLATPGAFNSRPGLVWEFYHYRRELAAKAQPNPGHIAIAEFENRHASEKNVLVITQNVDGLHTKAGSKNVLELHGSLFKTRCTKCGEVLVNTDSPICEALGNQGSPNADFTGSDISVMVLPHCKKRECGGLLRPHIVWFGENLERDVIEKADRAMSVCEVCLVVGTSSVVYPAAMYAPAAAARGAVVAEFNIESTPASSEFQYCFEGLCGKTLPPILTE